jgi:ERCC4-type nuclease
MFNNIFRKTKAKKKTIIKPHIIADHREKNSLVIPTLHELGIDVDIKELKVGDFQIGQTLIERKTFNDFLGSMINKRLLDQLKHLRQAKSALLIIEGWNIDSIARGERNINPNAIRGFILSISLEYQIPVIFTEDAEETALYLTVLAKRQLKNPTPISLHARIPKTKKEQKQYILEAFPNIGPITAEKLIKKFKNLTNIFAATADELEEILKKRTKTFKDLLE